MDVGVTVSRFDIFLVSLDPVQGSEIRKTRPCLVVSPNEMNAHINTVIIAPMTTTIRNYPTRVTVQFQIKTGQTVLDQIRTIDKSRLIKKLGTIKKQEAKEVLNVLQEMFGE